MVPLPYEQVRRSGGLSGAKIAVTAQGCGLWWFGSDKGCHHSSYAVASVNLPINNFPSSVAAVVNSTLVAEHSGPPQVEQRLTANEGATRSEGVSWFFFWESRFVAGANLWKWVDPNA